MAIVIIVIIVCTVVNSQHNYLCGHNKWTSNNIGAWSFIMDTEGCTLQQKDEDAKGAVIWLGNSYYDNISSLDWTDYSVEVSMSITSESSLNDLGYAGIIFRAQNISDDSNGGELYIVYMVIEHQKPLVISKLADRHYTEEASVSSNIVGGAIRSNQQYTLKIVVNGSNFAASFDGNKYTLNWTDETDTYNKGSVGLRTWEAAATFTSFHITWPVLYSTDIPTTVPTTALSSTIFNITNKLTNNLSKNTTSQMEQTVEKVFSNNSNDHNIPWIIIEIVGGVVVFLCIGLLIGYWLYRYVKYKREVKTLNKCVEEVFIDECNSKQE